MKETTVLENLAPFWAVVSGEGFLSFVQSLTSGALAFAAVYGVWRWRREEEWKNRRVLAADLTRSFAKMAYGLERVLLRVRLSQAVDANGLSAEAKWRWEDIQSVDAELAPLIQAFEDALFQFAAFYEIEGRTLMIEINRLSDLVQGIYSRLATAASPDATMAARAEASRDAQDWYDQLRNGNDDWPSLKSELTNIKTKIDEAVLRSRRRPI